MATRIRITHLIQCDVDAFWTSFLDAELARKIFLSDLGFPAYRLTQSTGEGGIVLRRVEITPKVNMPASVRRVLGSMFSYVEVGELELVPRVYRFTLLPPSNVRGDQATIEGVMRAERTPEHWTNRVVDWSVDIRVFGLGGMLESFAAKAAQDAYAAHANAMNASLAPTAKDRA